jgi:hypothetical protein
MYCAVEEAYDNPLSQQIRTMENENKINNHKDSLRKSIEKYQYNYGIIPPHETDYQPEVNTGIIQHPNFRQKFFTAQGDLEKNPYHENINKQYSEQGTTISELKRSKKNNDSLYGDSLSFLDSNYSDNLISDLDSQSYIEDTVVDETMYNNDIKNKMKHAHQYYIKKFIQGIIDEDLISLTSSQDNNVYDHIKECKYCKSQINMKMKQYYISHDKNNKDELIIPQSKNNELLKKQSENDIDDKFYKKNLSKFFSQTFVGYDIKEIIIIIIIGLCIIFILDMFVRIGKKTNK